MSITNSFFIKKVPYYFPLFKMKCPFFISNILLLAVVVILVDQCMCEGSNPNNVSNPEIKSKWSMMGTVSGAMRIGTISIKVSHSKMTTKKSINSSFWGVILIWSAQYPVYWTYDVLVSIKKIGVVLSYRPL